MEALQERRQDSHRSRAALTGYSTPHLVLARIKIKSLRLRIQMLGTKTHSQVQINSTMRLHKEETSVNQHLSLLQVRLRHLETKLIYSLIIALVSSRHQLDHRPQTFLMVVLATFLAFNSHPSRRQNRLIKMPIPDQSIRFKKSSNSSKQRLESNRRSKLQGKSLTSD